MKPSAINIRPWRMSDLDNLVKYANNRNVAKNMTDKFPHPYTENDGKSFIEFATKERPIHIFAIDLNNIAIGAIGIHQQCDVHRKNAELGYWLAEPYWGRGIISHSLKLIIDFAFTTYEIDRIFARPFGKNIASQRVLEKNNFILEAKFDRTLIKNKELDDELIYAIRREMWIK